MSSRIRTFLSLAVVLAASLVPAAGMSPRETAEALASVTGSERFGEVGQLDFTFHAQLGERLIERSWSWWPKEDRVRTVVDGERVEYLRSELDGDPSAAAAEADPKFINDLFWLIFPLNVVWDPAVDLEALDSEGLAVVPGAEQGLRVRYPDDVGYTPGDVYDLIYDDDFRVTHWVFRKGGSAEPTRVTAWQDYREVGPLLISMNRPGPGGDFRIWFSDVAVESAE